MEVRRAARFRFENMCTMHEGLEAVVRDGLGECGGGIWLGKLCLVVMIWRGGIKRFLVM